MCIVYYIKIDYGADDRMCVCVRMCVLRNYQNTHSNLSTFFHKVENLHKELTDHLDDSKNQFGNIANEIQIIRSNYVTDVGECRRSSSGLDQRLSKLEGVCGRFDSFSDSLERITEGLNHHVSGLWSCVNGLNITVKTHGDQIDTIQNFHLENVHSGMQRLNYSLMELAEDFHSFIQQDFMGKSWYKCCQVLYF